MSNYTKAIRQLLDDMQDVIDKHDKALGTDAEVLHRACETIHAYDVILGKVELSFDTVAEAAR
jgi:DNA-binding transcriptional regulator PaaX